MLSDLAKKSGDARLESALTVCVQSDFTLWQPNLHQALADPQAAVILLDLMCSSDRAGDPVSVLTAALEEHRQLERHPRAGTQASPASSRGCLVQAAIQERWLPMRRGCGTPM